HKAKAAAFDRVNGITNSLDQQYDILCEQEPYIDLYGNAKSNSKWEMVYPSLQHSERSGPVWAVTLINKGISTNSWEQLHFPSNNVVVIQVCGSWGRLTIFNIYNDGTHSRTLEKLE
ncbi:hypothetical protein ARMGADRAFT_897149, partial [Armillaria gallica]